MDAAQAKFDLERTDQQSLHEQTLRGHNAELSRQARRHWAGMTAQYWYTMQSLKAQCDSQLKQQQIRLSAEHKADNKAFMLRSASMHEKDVSALH